MSLTDTAHRRQDPPDFLSDAEVLRLMQALTAGKREIPEEHAITVHSWAVETRVRAMLLRLALRGEVTIEVRGGEVCFSSRTGRTVALGCNN